jgi:DNA-binding FrmR family transcriptional regulator
MSKALSWYSPAWNLGKACCLVGALVGCSIFNPHIDLPNPPPRYQDMYFAGDLPRAIDDANGLRAAYYGAVGDQAKLRNGLALTLIPLSAVALFYGITSPSSRGTKDFITGAVVGGGAAYGLGTLFLSDSKQAVYLAGSRALGCAVMAMRPYLIHDSQFTTMTTQVANLGVAIDQVRSDIAAIEALVGSGSTTTDVTAQLSAAREQLRRAESTRQGGLLLIGRIRSASIVLDTAVANIRDKVSEQILTTEPNLQAVMAVNSGLRQLGGQIMSGQLSALVPGGAKAVDGQMQSYSSGTPFDVARSRLNHDLEILIGAAAPVAFEVEITAAMERVAGDPLACEPANAVHRIEITPPAETVALGPSQKYQITVLGGTGIPRASVGGAYPEDVDAQLKLQNGAYVVEVAVVAKPHPGQRLLVIADASGRDQKVVTLDIGGADAVTKMGGGANTRTRTDLRPGAGSGIGTTKPPAVATDPLSDTLQAPAKLDPAEIKEIQAKLGLKPDRQTGLLDADTVQTVVAWQRLCALSPTNGILTQAQAKHIRQIGPEPCPRT